MRRGPSFTELQAVTTFDQFSPKMHIRSTVFVRQFCTVLNVLTKTSTLRNKPANRYIKFEDGHYYTIVMYKTMTWCITDDETTVIEHRKPAARIARNTIDFSIFKV